jgi:hypothetical protein
MPINGFYVGYVANGALMRCKGLRNGFCDCEGKRGYLLQSAEITGRGRTIPENSSFLWGKKSNYL